VTDDPEQGGLRPVTPVGILAASLRNIAGHGDWSAPADQSMVSALHDAGELAAGLEPYAAECTTPESPALKHLAYRTAATDWSASRAPSTTALEPEMLSGHVEGQFLKMLVAVTRSRRVLEIGMFTGYSALAMAEALPEDGLVVACEINAPAARIARQAFEASPHGGKIVVEVGAAADTLRRLATKGPPFDFIFLDADKAGYADYFNAILDGGLLAPHGVMCVDNTLLQGQAYVTGGSSDAGSAIRAFNRMVADDPRVEQVLVPLRDGVTIIRLVNAG
jgi:caffeoyl-CoA O-methyltransferase